MQRYTVYFIWKLLYIFRVVPPIIISANNCIYSIWYLSHRYCYLPLSWKSWNWFKCAVGGEWQITDAADTVVCTPDDGWWYYPKHVEQFPDKINCATLHLVGYILQYMARYFVVARQPVVFTKALDFRRQRTWSFPLKIHECLELPRVDKESMLPVTG